ncbi:MAG: hypothetical protein WCF08_05885, partial [Anaerolineaceae bacterium]
MQGSQDDILKEHQAERENRFPDHNFIDEGSSAMWADWKGGRLVAREIWDPVNDRMGVDVVFGEQAIYSIGLGIPSPIQNLQGIWTYNDHWILEVAGMPQQNNSESGAKSLWVGQIIRDEVSLNEEFGYEESFGFQLMFGKPFYFFQKEGQIGFSYDGQEELLGYKQLPHYACCSGAELNPIKAENMVAFFAQRDEKWYYVEIGVFSQ